MINKNGQVWIETVLYTLIGLALIGIVLAFAMPKINEIKDKATVEQAIDSLNELDEKINAVSGVPGNKRFLEFTIRTGELVFDVEDNVINFTIRGLEKPYSQPDVLIQSGRIGIISLLGQKDSTVSLTISYASRNLLFDDAELEKAFTPSSTPYRFSITNSGFGNINIVESSS